MLTAVTVGSYAAQHTVLRYYGITLAPVRICEQYVHHVGAYEMVLSFHYSTPHYTLSTFH